MIQQEFSSITLYITDLDHKLFIPLPHFICERKFYARTHVKINQPSGMPRNEKAGPKRPYKPPLPQTCLGYPALMTLNLL